MNMNGMRMNVIVNFHKINVYLYFIVDFYKNLYLIELSL